MASEHPVYIGIGFGPLNSQRLIQKISSLNVDDDPSLFLSLFLSKSLAA